jgi:hypothetical protein
MSNPQEQGLTVPSRARKKEWRVAALALCSRTTEPSTSREGIVLRLSLQVADAWKNLVLSSPARANLILARVHQ